VTLLFRRSAIALLTIVGLAIVLWSPSKLCAKNSGNDAEEQVCDPLADYYLGMEDYPAAIRLHQIVIREHPDNALAHYHLGFAYGVLGDHRKELMQYQQAVGLGLSDWQLFLNLGLLYMETGHLDNAAEVLRLSTLLGPNRPEAHFNLGLVYERLGMLRQAEQETLLSLRLDPGQLDARNMLGVIYAEEENYVRAREEWTEIIGSNPDYPPAHANVVILERIERGEIKGPKQISGFAHEP